MPLGPAHYIDAVLLVKSRAQPADAAGAVARGGARRRQPRAADDAAASHDATSEACAASAGQHDRRRSWPALVLTLACLGIFGVVVHAVKLRTKEIGIRRALGATAPDVVGTLLRQLAWPVTIGMTMGTAAGIGASRLLGGALFHLAVTDATAPAVALTVFTLSGLAAALFPASRAMHDDPVRALRHE